MAYTWSIDPETNTEISSNGIVTFHDNVARTYTVTCRDGDRCGKFTITRSNEGCEQPTVKGVRFVYEKNSTDGGAFDNYCFKTNEDINRGYVEHTTDSGNLEIYPINISKIANGLSVQRYNSCITLTNTSWKNDNFGDIISKAWGCTPNVSYSNWKTIDNPNTCDNKTYNYRIDIYLKNNTEYYIPYNGIFKIQDEKIYYRNYNVCDSLGTHFWYGGVEGEGQDSNFLLAPNREIKLECMSFNDVDISNISTKSVYSGLSNMTSKISGDNKICDYKLHTGTLLGSVYEGSRIGPIKDVQIVN